MKSPYNKSKKRILPFIISFLVLILAHNATANANRSAILDERLQALISLFKSPSKIDVEHYIKDHVDESWLRSEHQNILVNLFYDESVKLGKFKLEKLHNSDILYVQLDLKTSNSQKMRRVLVEFSEQYPHKIIDFRSLPYVPFEKLSTLDLEALDATLKSVAHETGFSGSLWFAKKGKTLFSKNYGYADKRYDVRISETTRFDLASITKDFTGIAVLQLAQNKQLKLDDVIGRYLPELPEDKKGITIRQLLRHRSGLGEYFFSKKYEHNKHSFTAIEDYLDIIAEQALLFPPGSAKTYSNSGFELLAMIIQRVSGKRYYQYIHDHIFEPAGMATADFEQPTLAQKNLARPYTNMSPLGPSEGFLREAVYIRAARGTASGGAIASMNDIQRYLKAIQSGTLLNGEYQALFLNRYKYSNSKNKTILMGAGGAPGVSTFYVIDFERDIELVMLSNIDERTPENIALAIYNDLSVFK